MSEGVLVAGAEARGQRLTFRVLAAVGVLVAICLLASRDLRGLGIVIAGAALVMLAVSEAVAAARRRARRWVVDTGSGFRWFGGPEELTIADGQVTALRLAYERSLWLCAHGLAAQHVGSVLFGDPGRWRAEPVALWHDHGPANIVQ